MNDELVRTPDRLGERGIWSEGLTVFSGSAERVLALPVIGWLAELVSGSKVIYEEGMRGLVQRREQMGELTGGADKPEALKWIDQREAVDLRVPQIRQPQLIGRERKSPDEHVGDHERLVRPLRPRGGAVGDAITWMRVQFGRTAEIRARLGKN